MSNPTPLNTSVNTYVNTSVNTLVNTTATPADAPVPTKMTVEEKHLERMRKINLAKERDLAKVAKAAEKAYTTKLNNLAKDAEKMKEKEEAKKIRIARRQEAKAAKESAKVEVKQHKVDSIAYVEGLLKQFEISTTGIVPDTNTKKAKKIIVGKNDLASKSDLFSSMQSPTYDATESEHNVSSSNLGNSVNSASFAPSSNIELANARVDPMSLPFEDVVPANGFGY